MNRLLGISNLLESAGISVELLAKWNNLITHLSSMESVVVAYSGGVDSTFLSYAAHLVFENKMCAVLIQSEIEAESQIADADRLADQIGFKYVKIPHEALNQPQFVSNSIDRCYYCKTHILNIIHHYAKENGYRFVLEGQNIDDQQDYRPGQKAVIESGTLSPLKEAALRKIEIRELARVLNLPVWDKPSSPCLASRFPYGQKITGEGIERVMMGEAYLHKLGFRNVRVRIHDDIARIEVEPEERGKLLNQADLVSSYFKSIGFLYVALDLQGYRQGSLNEGIIR